MKTFREKMSMTKLVFFLLTLVLSFQTIYLTIQWVGTDLFNNAMLMIISFYFGQKSTKNEKIDSLVETEEGQI